MADVSQVFSGLLMRPAMPEGQTCDYCDALATVRLQGETDSWGAEWLDLCAHHAERVAANATFAYCVDCEVLFELEDPDEQMPRCADHCAAGSTDEQREASGS
jgi:hypothetical protein